MMSGSGPIPEPGHMHVISILDNADSKKSSQRVPQADKDGKKDKNALQYFGRNILAGSRPDHRPDKDADQFGTDHRPINHHAFENHEVENGEYHPD